jgi:hypothetical protein
MREPYEHKHDEVDDMMLALGRVLNAEGKAAAWAMLPTGLRPHIKRIAKIKHVGFITATEIALRMAVALEGMDNA